MTNEKRRLIDAFTLAEEIESLTITVAGKPARWNDAKHSVLCVLAEQPDVDAVEVVRCKDCAVPHNKWTGCPKLSGLVPPPDFYCAYGERNRND